MSHTDTRIWSFLIKCRQMGFLVVKIRSVPRIVYFMSHKEDMLKLSLKNLGNLTQKIDILTWV